MRQTTQSRFDLRALIGQLEKPERTALIGAGAFSLCINLLMLAVPIYMLQVYDRVLTSHSLETLVLLTIWAIGAVALMAALDGVRGQVLLRIGLRLDQRLSGRALGASVRKALSHQGGDAQALRDLSQIRAFLASPVAASLLDAPLMPLYLIVIGLIHPLLGFLALVGALGLMGLAILNQRATERGVKKAAAETAFILNDAERQMRNADAIQAMGLLPALTARWRRFHDATLKEQLASAKTGGRYHASTRFMRFLLQVLALGFGALLVLEGEITAGMMFAASIIVGRGMAPIDAAVAAWPRLIEAGDAYRRLHLLLAETAEPQGQFSLPTPEGALAIENVVYMAPGTNRAILRGVSFTLESGVHLGVMGPMAAGKSTLGKLLLGVLTPTGGKVRLDGADITQWPRAALGKHVGYLPQDVDMFTAAVAETIARMGTVDAEKVVEAAKRTGAHEMILRLPNGYDTVIGPGAYQLSPGQAQWIGLARAMYGDPKLVVLDEPNANLDAEGEMALAASLADLKSRSITTVIVAHNPTILHQVDKLLILKDGAIQAFGPRDEIWSRLHPVPRPAGFKVFPTNPGARKA